MYHFRVRSVVLFLLLSVLTSCATTTKNDDANTAGVDQTSDSKLGASNNADNSLGGTSNAQGLGVKDDSAKVIDPMRDIQINAEIKSTYKQVAKLNKLKQYPQAIKLLDGIQAKYPQLSGPDYQRARIYFGQSKFDLALKSIDSSLSNNSRNYYSLNLKGIILREQGKFEEAREIYFMAIEAYPAYPNSHLNLGVLADIYLRDLPLALLQYREYMKLTSNQDKKVANWVLELERRIKAGG